MVGLLFIVIAIVVLLMRSLITPSKNDPVRIPGVGVIQRRIDDDCRVIFYVEFRDQRGNVFVGKSITYRSTKGKYQAGATANIRYFFSPKGRPFVEIIDPDLVSCEEAAKPVATVMLVAAIALMVIGVVTLVLSFLA